MWTRRFYGRKTIARATHGLMSNNKNEPGRPLTSEKTRNYYYHFLNARWVRCRDKTEPLLIIRLGPSTRYASIVSLRRIRRAYHGDCTDTSDVARNGKNVWHCVSTVQTRSENLLKQYFSDVDNTFGKPSK